MAELKGAFIMEIKKLPEFTAGARNRAQTALNIILDDPEQIDSRKYDQCFEHALRVRERAKLQTVLATLRIEDPSQLCCGVLQMFDGKDVALLIIHTLKLNNIGFSQLPYRVQRYWGLSWWNRLEKEYTDLIQSQLTLPL